MYWIVRGVVAVTSRDGEAILAELKPGAFFGEIGILMDVPRTATIVARTKCLLVSLRKEDLRAELPRWPEMERRIREEAQERLAVLNKKRQEGGYGTLFHAELPTRGNRNLARAAEPGSVGIGEVGRIAGGAVQNSLKRKSPSPSPAMLDDPSTGSALGNGLVNVRKTLMELPLFAGLPNEILHFLGLSAQPRSYAPFCDIIRQGSLGNEIYFIVRGEAEVVHMRRREDGVVVEAEGPRPRLKQGMYFGEVASLALAPRRTATVRAITTVECLMISGEVLEELWRRCSPDLRKQVEHTAKERYGKPKDTDIMMLDAEHEEINGSSISDLKISDSSPKMRDRDLPQVTFTPSFSSPPSPRQPSADEDPAEPTDVDPFLSVDMEAMKTRQMGRRQSWAPVPAEPTSPPKEGGGDVNDTSSPLTRSPGPSSMFSHPITPPQEAQLRSKRARQTLDRRPSEFSQGRLPDSVLLSIFKQLDIYQLMRLRSVSLHWQRLLSFHPALCRTLDLTPFNRHITNTALIDSILPFAGNRPREVDISNCFHITDLGFQALSRQLSPNVKVWKMKSVWDISAAAVLEMANAAKELEEIDLSNCRKVSDNLLARIVGWVVTEAQHAKPPPPRRGKGALSGSAASQAQPPPPPLPGTVIGCPKLRRLTLSYCKHITDRSMAHLAVHAHERLESIDLTRCTTITDAGFAHWGAYRWGQLRRVRLADCTYLGDQAVVSLCHAAPGVRMLDLVGDVVSLLPSLFVVMFSKEQECFDWVVTDEI